MLSEEIKECIEKHQSSHMTIGVDNRSYLPKNWLFFRNCKVCFREWSEDQNNKIVEELTEKNQAVRSKYYELLREAFETQREVDYFDLNSKDRESIAKWEILLKESESAQIALISFIRVNSTLERIL